MIRNKIKEILAKKNIRQSSLVEVTDVTKATISNIVNNKYEPSIGLALKIAEFLNMTIEEIFYDEDDYRPWLTPSEEDMIEELNKLSSSNIYKVEMVIVMPKNVDEDEIKERFSKIKSLNAIVTNISQLIVK